MTDATNTIDTWTATTHADLEQLRAGLLDLIDCGPHPNNDDPVLRRPDKELADAMRRGADRDADYRQPPSVRTHNPGTISDPTTRQILRWEQAVADATRDAAHITDAAWHAITMIDVVHHHDVHNRHGQPLTPPPHPTVDDHPTRPRVLDDPATCRRHVLDHLAWATQVVDALADTWRRTEPAGRSVDPEIAVHCRRYAGAIARTARRHRNLPAPTGPTRCLNPHGDNPHPVPPGQQICDACTRPACTDPLDRRCRRRLSAADVTRNRTACGACRTTQSRRRRS